MISHAYIPQDGRGRWARAAFPALTLLTMGPVILAIIGLMAHDQGLTVSELGSRALGPWLDRGPRAELRRLDREIDRLLAIQPDWTRCLEQNSVDIGIVTRESHWLGRTGPDGPRTERLAHLEGEREQLLAHLDEVRARLRELGDRRRRLAVREGLPFRILPTYPPAPRPAATREGER